MDSETDALMIYTTFPSSDEAKSVAKTVVGSRLAACANILPGMISVYEWEDKLEEGAEVVALFKTTKSRKSELMAKVKELHSYTVPAILVLNIDDVEGEYMDWLLQQTI